MTVRAAEFNSESLPAPYSEEEAAAYVRNCGWRRPKAQVDSAQAEWDFHRRG